MEGLFETGLVIGDSFVRRLAFYHAERFKPNGYFYVHSAPVTGQFHE